MIELTPDQRHDLAQSPDTPPRVLDPATGESYVLLSNPQYQRLKSLSYDASPWTDEEMHLLAAEDAASLGWEGMEAYQGDQP